jgi:hypothetical protein
MKTRFDKLVVVRGAASRTASGAFAEASMRAAGQADMAGRLQNAASILSPEVGSATGAGLGAQLELAGRIDTACRVARARVEEATSERDEAAVARKAARRALDAAVDIRREHGRAAVLRREARAVTIAVKDRA